MRYIAVLILAVLPAFCFAQDWEDQQKFGANGTPILRILSSTDTSFFAPIIDSFIVGQPNVSVEYIVTGTADLDNEFRQNPDRFDVVISSAMDLQLKLTNDGFAQRLDGISHPDWAQWRSSLFAFTTEPAAIVLNAAAFDGLATPRTRQDLIEVLRANPDIFMGKVGTYDVRRSGLGYLFATQDARTSETFWRLMEVMGSLDARLYCCSGDMIDDLIEGRILVAYNVLGSYAEGRADTADTLTVILPSDFPTTMMRSALVSKSASDPALAEAFVNHLIGLQSGGARAAFPLPPLNSGQDPTGQSSIGLEPALMTYLDALKRQTFVREWEEAIIQD
ncbi:ABC transporter substrate-binding protein [Octadecabacter sp. G9-8]|uniref:ABC transporter substrate-binding protein n=1 Tax=Octadecabacter dasysiphoniae TaxID=2909341 RepID=A0ABS9CZ50_9RHOB|nr:ABC transporter substrate-binding protein [Octadecabacter dasysiphoniae]MCF2872079.1 ABC transporter substrate-binding protein [Octadecabacter dasysiphoniae]